MEATLKAGTILIREGTCLPPGVLLESAVFSQGWRVLKNLDGHILSRKIEEGGWSFFFLAGHIQATALGREEQNTVRRAILKILKRLRANQFNSLQVTDLAWKRFLGVSYVHVAAHCRQIQESLLLVAAKDRQVRTAVHMASTHGAATGATISEPAETLISGS